MTSWCTKPPLGLIQSAEMSSNFGQPQNTKTTRVYFSPKHNFCGAYECHLSLQNIWLIKPNIKKQKAAPSCFKKFVFILFVCLLFFFQESGIPERWQTSPFRHMTQSSGFTSTCYTGYTQVTRVERVERVTYDREQSQSSSRSVRLNPDTLIQFKLQWKYHEIEIFLI